MYDEDDSSASIPPEPVARHKRRSNDRINWRRVMITAAMSMPITGPGIYQGGIMLMDAHAQWLEFKKMPARLEQLEERTKEHEALEKKLASLERWRCVLGYDPGGKLGQATILPRDRRAECRANAAEAAPAPAN